MEPIDKRKVEKMGDTGNDTMKYNNLWLGVIAGILSPLITLFIYYSINFGHLTFNEFLHGSFMLNVSSAIMSLCLLSNLLVFFISILTNRNESARGVLTATFFYTIPVVYLKFFA